LVVFFILSCISALHDGFSKAIVLFN